MEAFCVSEALGDLRGSFWKFRGLSWGSHGARGFLGGIFGAFRSSSNRASGPLGAILTPRVVNTVGFRVFRRRQSSLGTILGRSWGVIGRSWSLFWGRLGPYFMHHEALETYRKQNPEKLHHITSGFRAIPPPCLGFVGKPIGCSLGSFGRLTASLLGAVSKMLRFGAFGSIFWASWGLLWA